MAIVQRTTFAQGRPGCGQRRLHIQQRLTGLLGQRAADDGTIWPHCVLPADVYGLRRPLDHHGLGEGGVADQGFGVEVRLHVTI